MDELDIKILRALISESAIGLTNIQMSSSLRQIAKRLGADDTTVSSRFNKLRELGCMSVWKLAINPTFFGYKMLDVMVDVLPQSAKDDMIRKLRFLDQTLAIVNFHGSALKIFLLYNEDGSRSRTIELISRTTNAERVTISRMALPKSETNSLRKSDMSILSAMTNDARKSPSIVASELHLSPRTVKNRLEKLRKEKTILTMPDLRFEDIPGFLVVYLSYSYADNALKDRVDKAMISHFDSNYLWGGFSDPERSFIVLNAFAMADMRRFLQWSKEEPGVASARIDIPIETRSFPEKLRELASSRKSDQLTAQT
ncbi:MAG TPA: AsnC family transcriptional regulator [Nitrososphaerales archaeon]|nr:AsnC family transcriptional regulator [Nitrososphaerales archaeon]